MAGNLPARSSEENPPRRVRSSALNGLFILAVFYTLYFARLFLLPLVLAFLLSLLLSPAVRGLNKFRVPAGLGAAFVVVMLLGVVSAAGYLLIDPAIAWFEQAPGSLDRVEVKLRQLRKPLEELRRTTEKMERLTRIGREPREMPVRVQPESFSDVIIGNAQAVLTGLGVMLILLYFLLASGDLFLRKMIRVLPRLKEKKRIVKIARDLNRDISVYLLTITLINLCLGVAEGTAMYLLGMPNPLLWGAMATMLNFVPYLGAMAGTAVIALVAVLTFETPAGILLPPLVYYLITGTEGNFVTPYILGRRLTLNPVVIILGLIFWGWLWGIIGALLAVPLLVSFKIFCEHFRSLKPVGELLGR